MTGLVVLTLVVFVIWLASSVLAIWVGRVVIDQYEQRLTPTVDPQQVLAELRSTITHGKWSLDTVLQRIAEAAQMVTCSNGAAIALRRDDVILCQARAGDLAPDLGTKLDTDSGISGECLRTGWALRCDDTDNDTRVDAEVCRQLGLRSLAVVPVGKKPAVNGVLEAFSLLPYAFRPNPVESRNNPMELLEELAELVNVAKRRSAVAAQATSKKVWTTVPTLAWLANSRGLRRQASELVLRQAKAFLAPSAAELVGGLVGAFLLALLGWVIFRRLRLL